MQPSALYAENDLALASGGTQDIASGRMVTESPNSVLTREVTAAMRSHGQVRAACHRCCGVVLAVAAVLALAACGSGSASESRYEGLAVPASQLRQVPDMAFADTDGNEMHLAADTQGQVRLVYQMFTNCPDICGVQLAQLASVLNRPGAPTNVAVLAVTVDPDRDSPDVLRAYLDQFSDDFVGLIPHSEQQLTDLQNELGALASIKIFDTTTTGAHGMTGMDHDDMSAMDHSDVDYDIAHDARVFAYAPNGYGYAQYPHPTRQTQFDHDLPILAGIEPNAPAEAGL